MSPPTNNCRHRRTEHSKS